VTGTAALRAFLLAAGVGVGLWGSTTAAGAAAPGVKAGIKKQVLTVTGTPGPDTITLRLRVGDPNTLEVDVGTDGIADFSFDRSRFTTIVVEGGSGNDTLVASPLGGTFTSTHPTTLDGGDGNDTLLGEAGAERLLGGTGDDLADGHQGADTIALGDGADVFQWDPGDGSDVVTGGAGIDRLAFNGSNVGETIELTAAGAGHVRLTRDVGNVVTDLDDLEVVDLRTSGGADTVVVNNLAGTDVTEVRTDLAAAIGGDDQAIDSVLVAPGLTFGQDAQGATVDGLGAKVRVLNGSPTDRIHVTGASASDVVRVAGTAAADTVNVVADGTDVAVYGATAAMQLRLTTVELADIDLGTGNDSFSVTGNVAALISLDADGGDGDDTLLGGNGADTLRGGAGNDFLDGNQGADTLLGGDGSDVVQWDPGDSSDVVDGEAGVDRLAFNGSSASERFELSTLPGGHARLFRDVGNIVTDLDNVESIDLRLLAGTDFLTVNDLAGSDLVEVRADLAAVGGGDDAAIDSVVVPPGLTVGQDGSAGTVEGLGAKVRVLNGSPTDRIHVTANTPADVVKVAGTAGADTVNAVADGTDVAVFGATPGAHLHLTGISRLDVDLGAGGDTFTATGNLAALIILDVDGGDGDDILLGGNGADVLSGGAGDDFLDGNQGADTLAGGDGFDGFQWDPGDGSDTVNGGAGADRVVFNGSGANERIELSAAGAGHARLTRDVAAIIMDLDDVERVDLRTFGGTDTVTVNDLTGTELVDVRTDLAAVGGGDDLQIDNVVVNGTAGDDTLAIVDSGPDVVVQGGAATVRITNAAPTADRLTVNGLAGNDVVTATPAAGSLIVLDLVP
jgi:Ca2+-binding RTX toxin-like protein